MKLAAFASFNQTEKDLLQTAFARVGEEHGGIPGLATRGEFMDVFDRLGVRLTPAHVDAMFGRATQRHPTCFSPSFLEVSSIL